MKNKKITPPDLKKMKKQGEKITVLTAYDYTFALLMERANIDVLLVGDTLGMIVQGNEDTLPVTIEDIIYHTRAVKRASKRSMVVADMPFMSYQVTEEEAVRNAGRIMKESGADAVKLEGGIQAADAIDHMTSAGIPVMGHIGLGPQSSKALGGYKIQGKTSESIKQIIEDAKIIEEAGAFSMVIEAVPWKVAELISERVSIPTIGIGAGPHCDGQVLVFADMLGLFTAFQPHFVRRFTNMAETSVQAFEEYSKSVKDGSFPSIDESYPLDEEIYKELMSDNL